MTDRAPLYRCTGCSRPFASWRELRKHHQGCLRFMERQDGVVRSRKTAGAAQRYATRKEAL